MIFIKKPFIPIFFLLFLCTACSHDQELRVGYADDDHEFQTNFDEPITSVETINIVQQIMKQAEQVPMTERPTEIEPVTVMHNSQKESVTFNAYQLYLLDDQSILFTHAIHQSDSVNEAFLLSEADSDTLKELLLIEEAQ